MISHPKMMTTKVCNRIHETGAALDRLQATANTFRAVVINWLKRKNNRKFLTEIRNAMGLRPTRQNRIGVHKPWSNL